MFIRLLGMVRYTRGKWSEYEKGLITQTYAEGFLQTHTTSKSRIVSNWVHCQCVHKHQPIWFIARDFFPFVLYLFLFLLLGVDDDTATIKWMFAWSLALPFRIFVKIFLFHHHVLSLSFKAVQRFNLVTNIPFQK